MRRPIKIIIKRPKQTKGDWAFYREIDRILLTDAGAIKTEAHFCAYIYRKFGVGRYQCLAWQKGHEGFWLFWLGNLYNNGFVRDLNKNKELERLKVNFDKAKSFDEKEEIEEEMQFEKELSAEEKKLKRRGPVGLIKLRPGVLHEYQNP